MNKPEEYKWPNVKCPVCSRGLPAQTNITENHGGPEAGDWALCANCAIPLIFDIFEGKLQLCLPTKADIDALRAAPDKLLLMVLAQEALRWEKRIAALNN